MCTKIYFSTTPLNLGGFYFLVMSHRSFITAPCTGAEANRIGCRCRRLNRHRLTYWKFFLLTLFSIIQALTNNMWLKCCALIESRGLLVPISNLCLALKGVY